MKSMLNRDIPPIFEEQSFDPNRDFVITTNKDQGKLSPLTFLTGGVSTTYGSKADTAMVSPKVAQLINTKDARVSSITGQQQLDYRSGIFTLNTPKAKAVTGFLGTKQVFTLGDVTIQSASAYATIEVVSMDGLPTDRSKKLLVQVGTIFKPTGWAEEATTITDKGKPITGFRITNTGKMPWLGMPVNGSISLTNKVIRKATQLDAAGYALKPLDLQVTATGHSLQLPADAFYILLER